MREMFSGAARPSQRARQNPAAGLAPQLADSRAAFALVRRRAVEWRVNPVKVGVVGVSAGAMLTLTTELAGSEAKPASIDIIHGPLMSVTFPADAPPMFVALSADDPFFGGGGLGLIESWRAAKKPVEFHLFEQGGHGFGMYQKTFTSTGWFEEFTCWLTMHGW